VKTKSTIVAALICAICAAAAGQALANRKDQNATPSASRAPFAGCPRISVPPEYGTIDEAVAAARKLLVRGSITVQGKTTRLTRKNSPVLSIVTLAETSVPFPGAAVLRATATRRCGRNTAAASWAVMLAVPDLTPTASTRFAFLVKTKSGWRKY
jgi:hypothetical protein